MLRRLLARLRDVPQHENNVLVLTAVLVGLLAGLGAVSLEYLLRFVARVALGSDSLVNITPWRVLVVPALGGLIAGPVVARFATEAKGHGVPEVMEAVALKGGRIRGRVAIVKTFASAVTIGTGGSAGREGPIVQVGSTLGSKVGQLLGMSESRVRLLVGCGAAGGIAAAFNAPLAGVFFALEVILQRFTARGFATVVLTAVTASVIWRSAFGNHAVLSVPSFGLASPLELALYVLLGVLAALVGVAFVRTLYFFEDRFDAWRFPEELKPLVGGILLGALGFGLIQIARGPLVYGSGLPGIDLALGNELTWWLLLVLLVAKVLATSFTLGSGASGGVFAPALFMGAMLGGAFGQGVHALMPTATAPPGAYAMVGMAAVFAAAAQAPISAILILFEMTNDYLIILPLMLACIVATVTYGLIRKYSIYTLKLKRKGIELTEGRERHLIERTALRTAMVRDFPSVTLPATVADAREALRETSAEILVVLDEEGKLLDTLSAQRIFDAVDKDPTPSLESMLGDVATALVPWESLDTALSRLAPRGLRGLPVIKDRGSRQVIGIVTRESLMAAYWRTLENESKPATAPGRPEA